MKRLILTILCLLLAVPCFAQDQLAMLQGVVGSGGGTVAFHCADTSDSDVLCEDVEGATDCGDDAAGDTNCRNTWDSLETGGAIVFDATHYGTLSCSDRGIGAIQITKDNTGFTSVETKKSFSAVDNAWVQLYINVVTGVETSGETLIFSIRDASANEDISLRLYNNSGTQYFKILYHNGTTINVGSGKAITAGTWYRLRFIWKKSSGSNDGWVKFYVGDTEVTSVENNNSVRQVGRIALGSVAPDTETFVLQIDDIKIDDDSEPGVCK